MYIEPCRHTQNEQKGILKWFQNTTALFIKCIDGNISWTTLWEFYKFSKYLAHYGTYKNYIFKSFSFL